VEVPNLIGGKAAPARSGAWLEKVRPADESVLCRVARSGAEDVDDAVAAARAAQPAWAELTAVARGDVVRELALLLRGRRRELSELVVEETGKPLELALGETDAAVEMGLFVAGEGRCSYGRTTTASMAHRTVLTVRQPLGVAALVTSFNGGTHGSEPHVGFGGVKQSGTGWREAGMEALDVYSDWKVVNVIADPEKS
jgi:aldehyde dehydrogenase (NAD+)